MPSFTPVSAAARGHPPPRARRRCSAPHAGAALPPRAGAALCGSATPPRPSRAAAAQPSAWAAAGAGCSEQSAARIGPAAQAQPRRRRPLHAGGRARRRAVRRRAARSAAARRARPQPLPQARAVMPKSIARTDDRFCAYAMRSRSSSVLEQTILPLADVATTPPELRARARPRSASLPPAAPPGAVRGAQAWQRRHNIAMLWACRPRGVAPRVGRASLRGAQRVCRPRTQNRRSAAGGSG